MALTFRLPKRSRGFCLYTSKVMRAISLLCFGFSRPRPYDSTPLCRRMSLLVQWTLTPPSALDQTHLLLGLCPLCPGQLRGSPCASVPNIRVRLENEHWKTTKDWWPNSASAVLSPWWGSSSVPTPAPSGTYHPPASGRSPHFPQRSHPLLVPVLMLHAAAGSLVPIQWQEAGGAVIMPCPSPFWLPNIDLLSLDTLVSIPSLLWCFALPGNGSSSLNVLQLSGDPH